MPGDAERERRWLGEPAVRNRLGGEAGERRLIDQRLGQRRRRKIVQAPRR